QRQNRGERRLPGALSQPPYPVMEQPVAVLVDRVPPQQETNLGFHELPALTRTRPVRVAQVLAGPADHLETESELRDAGRERDQPVSGRGERATHRSQRPQPPRPGRPPVPAPARSAAAAGPPPSPPATRSRTGSPSACARSAAPRNARSRERRSAPKSSPNPHRTPTGLTCAATHTSAWPAPTVRPGIPAREPHQALPRRARSRRRSCCGDAADCCAWAQAQQYEPSVPPTSGQRTVPCREECATTARQSPQRCPRASPACRRTPGRLSR